MADLIALKNKADSLIAAIAAKQDDYFLAHGKYFQGLQTPIVACDGTTYESIDPSLKPSDQNESWDDFNNLAFTTTSKLQFRIHVDVYMQPHGERDQSKWGWLFTAEFDDGGEHYIYVHHEGPSEYPPVNTDIFGKWHIVKLGELP